MSRAYMLACTALLALFLGFGKRRHELAVENAGKQRAALEAYTRDARSTWRSPSPGARRPSTYVAYTLDPATRAFFNTNYLWLTAPFTVFGIVRFLLLVPARAGRGLKAESPTQEMLRDVPFVLNLVLWVASWSAIVYGCVRTRKGAAGRGSARAPGRVSCGILDDCSRARFM